MATIVPKATKIDAPNPPDINPVEFIKQVVENVNSQLFSLDVEIGYASQGDSSYVKALYDSLHEMKSRAEQADMILAQILEDPVKLEFSIARIEGPSATYSNMRSLVDSVTELEKEVIEGEYDYFRVVADLLVEVQQKMAAFEAFSATAQIRMVKNKINAIETELKRQVQWSFREIGQLASSDRYREGGEEAPPESEVKSDLHFLDQIYLVVNALGEKFTNDLMERFAQLQLIPYEKMFKLGTKYAGLECLDQRYAWFKYLLSAVDSKLSNVLQPHWKAPKYLFIEFSRRTKKHIGDILAEREKESPEANAHVAFMLKSLKSILAFEAEMKASFSIKSRDQDLEETSQSTQLDESISEVFDSYLGPYVQLEREGLEKLMETVIAAEDNHGVPVTGSQDGETPPPIALKPDEPFESSRKMFEYIKNSLKRCTIYSTGLTYLSLSKEFRICLQQYAESLKFRCPSPIALGKNGKSPIYNINKQIEATLCRIICTGDYCIETVPQLEAMMKQRIHPTLTNEVDFSAQIDAFMDMVSFTMGVLASGEIFRMGEDFIKMRETSWNTLEEVGDVSPYAKHTFRILTDGVVRIRTTMSSAYFQNVCTKLASVYLDEFLENIWQLRRVSKTGGAQLLMDLNGIKEYLMKMPNVKLPDGIEPIKISLAYTSIVNAKCKKIENVLKLVCTEDNMMEETFSVLWPDGTTADMEAVNRIKGKGVILPISTAIPKNIKLGPGTVTDFTSNIIKGGDNVKNAVRDIFTGNLFQDDSSHGHGHGHGSGNSHVGNPLGGVGVGGSKAVGDIKHGLNAAIGLFSGTTPVVSREKEKGVGAGTGTGTGSSSASKSNGGGRRS